MKICIIGTGYVGLVSGACFADLGNSVFCVDHDVNKIDMLNERLPILKSFILPGGSELSVKFHIARSVCRRCERLVVELSENENLDCLIIKYLNRLSDLLFVWSRYITISLNLDEKYWSP